MVPPTVGKASHVNEQAWQLCPRDTPTGKPDLDNGLMGLCSLVILGHTHKQLNLTLSQVWQYTSLIPVLRGRGRQIFVSSRPTWSTWWILGQPGLCRERLTPKPIKNPNEQTSKQSQQRQQQKLQTQPTSLPSPQKLNQPTNQPSKPNTSQRISFTDIVPVVIDFCKWRHW